MKDTKKDESIEIEAPVIDAMDAVLAGFAYIDENGEVQGIDDEK